jgi:hypothetical protein
MMDDHELLFWLASAGASAGGILIMSLMTRSISQMDKEIDGHGETLKQHAQMHAECGLELARFKAEVARDYAKDATIQQSLGRLHNRMDDMATTMAEGFKDVQNDIKALIRGQR